MTEPAGQPTPPAVPVAAPPVTPATEPVTTPAMGAPQTPPADADKPLGPAGERALAAEREARKLLEAELKTLAPLKKLAESMGGGAIAAGKTELEALAERQAAMETTIATEREARHRAEVAHEKGLTPDQAALLVGKTRDELVAYADRLLALFPKAAGPTGPAPDMSQGARGTAGNASLDAQIAEATKAGNVALAVSLQNQKMRSTN